MVFNLEDKLWKFYITYTHQQGFGITKKNSKNIAWKDTKSIVAYNVILN